MKVLPCLSYPLAHQSAAHMAEFLYAIQHVIQHVTTVLDYQSFIRLGAISKDIHELTLQQLCPLGHEHLQCWLTQLSKERAITESAAATSLAALAKNHTKLGSDNMRLDIIASIPNISLECATALIAVGLQPTYQHIRAAALQGIPGVFIWSHAFNHVRVASGFPREIDTVCLGLQVLVSE